MLTESLSGILPGSTGSLLGSAHGIQQTVHAFAIALLPVSVVGTPGHSTLKNVDFDRDESGTGAWYGNMWKDYLDIVTFLLLQDGFRFVIHVRETSKSPNGDKPRSSRRPRISTFTRGGSVARIVRSDVLDGIIVTVRGVGSSRSSLGLCRSLDGPGRRVGLSGTGLTGCSGGRVAIQAGVVVGSQLVEVDSAGRGGLRGGHGFDRWYGRL